MREPTILTLTPTEIADTANELGASVGLVSIVLANRPDSWASLVYWVRWAMRRHPV